MLQGLVRIVSNEMSHDDFMETYGRTRSDSGSSGKSESWDGSDNRSASIGSYNTIGEETSQTECDAYMQNNNNSETNRNCEAYHQYHQSFKAAYDKMDNPQHAATPATLATPDTRRRNSKISNIASRLARKSFRMVKRKTASESSGPGEARTPRSATPTRWNALLFRRSQSVTRSPGDCEATSYRALPDGDILTASTSSPTSSPSESRPAVARSTSHSPVVTSPKKTTPAALKRKSLPARNSFQSAASNKEENLHQNERRQVVNDQEHLERPSFLPCSPTVSPTKLFSHEYDLARKYDTIRENEEMRVVAIVTLLNRRKNSLKIKCDQFDKDLNEEDEISEERARVVRARLRQMRRKLNVVEQCINEQQEAMKVCSAKIDLQMSLELYQLELQREEQSSYDVTGRYGRRNSRHRRKTTLTSSGSCETLESVDEASVFDDSSSVMSLEHKESCFHSPLPRYKRHSSVPYGGPSPTRQQTKLHLDGCVEESTDTGRSRSIDCAVTSDCDSGFDNGDALSRSDVSLDRSLSKSTGSISSSCSRSTRPDSRADRGNASPNEQSGYKFFSPQSNSSSEQSLYTGAGKSSLKPNKSRRNSSSSQEVNTTVLAQIEDFERFAEKTMRRLSNNGKLVPLKKGT